MKVIASVEVDEHEWRDRHREVEATLRRRAREQGFGAADYELFLTGDEARGVYVAEARERDPLTRPLAYDDRGIA